MSRRLTTVVDVVRRRKHAPPVAWLNSGTWPHGPLSPDAPPEAITARAIAANLDVAIQRRSVRQLAADADLAHTTIYDLLAGNTYGDVITISRLEAALDQRLWPER